MSDPVPLRSAARQFGRLVRRERAYRGWTQEQLAERAGLHDTYVGRLERGESQPTLETLLRLGWALSVPASEWVALVEREWEPEP